MNDEILDKARKVRKALEEVRMKLKNARDNGLRISYWSGRNGCNYDLNFTDKYTMDVIKTLVVTSLEREEKALEKEFESL